MDIRQINDDLIRIRHGRRVYFLEARVNGTWDVTYVDTVLKSGFLNKVAAAEWIRKR